MRLSETGPTATAFWRGALALPFLAVWVLLERPGRSAAAANFVAPPSRLEPLFLWAGVFFAGDLALWHASLLLTSIAASTLEANCAPILVTLAAWALWGERPRLGFLLALAGAFGGMLLILVPKLGAGGHALLGDALGLGTAGFYAGYILAVSRLRTRHGTGIVMFTSTLAGVGVRAAPGVMIVPLQRAFGWDVSTISAAIAHSPASWTSPGSPSPVILWVA